MEEACGRQENWSLLGFPILLSFFPAALLCDNKYNISIDGLVLYYVCCVFVTGLILTALSFFFFPSVICYIFCNGSAWIVSCYFLCICCCSKYLFIYMFNKILATGIRAWYLFIYMLEISIYLFIYCFGKIYTGLFV